jgi:hypothetical protein
MIFRRKHKPMPQGRKFSIQRHKPPQVYLHVPVTSKRGNPKFLHPSGEWRPPSKGRLLKIFKPLRFREPTLPKSLLSPPQNDDFKEMGYALSIRLVKLFFKPLSIIINCKPTTLNIIEPISGGTTTPSTSKNLGKFMKTLVVTHQYSSE